MGRLKWVATACLVSALAVTAGAAVALRAAPPAGAEELAQSLTSGMRVCVEGSGVRIEGMSSEQVNSQDTRSRVTQCLGPVLEDLVVRAGPDLAWQVMLIASRSDPLFADCHEAAHYLAHGASRVVGEDELVRFSQPACSYGYLDGVSMVIAERHPEWGVAEVLSSVSRACANYPREGPDWEGVANNCFHGTGHVLWDRLGPDMSAVFAACSLLDGTSAYPGAVPPSAQCVGGAAMSIPVTTSGTGAQVRPFLAYPSMYCGGLEPVSQRQCLMYTFDADLEARPGGAREYLRWCLSEGSGVGDPSGCFGAVGGRAGFFRALEDFLVPCLSVAGNRQEYAGTCVQSAVDGMVAITSGGMTRADASAEVCREVSQACEPLMRAEDRG